MQPSDQTPVMYPHFGFAGQMGEYPMPQFAPPHLMYKQHSFQPVELGPSPDNRQKQP